MKSLHRIACILLVCVTFTGACSKSEKELVTIGDPSAASGNPITLAQLMMNTAGYLDQKAKLRVEFGRTGNPSEGYQSVMVVSASGPFEIRVADTYKPQIDQLEAGDSFIAIGQLGAAGSEGNPRLVFQVD